MQVDRVAMLATDFAARDVDPVFHQQIENVAQDADAVLAVDFDTHINRPKEALNGLRPDVQPVGASLLAMAE